MSAPILAGLAVAILAIGYVVAPLIWPAVFGVGQPAASTGTGDTAGDALERLRDALYAQIVALDFEHTTGKTDEEEYRQERDALKRRALAVLRTLDEHTARTPADDEADDVEREIRAARARRAAAVPAAAASPAASDDALLADAVEREVLALRHDRRAAGAHSGNRG